MEDVKKVRLVRPGNGDIDTDGNLVRPRFLVVGYKTHEHNEEGWRSELETAEDVSTLVQGLLQLGYLTVMVEDVQQITLSAA